MGEKLTQADFEDLSAYMDGELAEPDLSRVRGMLETSPAWRGALSRLEAVDRALEAYVTPAPPADLAGRVIHASAVSAGAGRHAAMSRPALRWLVPLSAAAALVVALLVYGAINRPASRTARLPHTPIAKQPSPATQADRTRREIEQEMQDDGEYLDMVEAEMDRTDTLVEEHLDFFRDIHVIKNLDTIEEIYNLESRGGGT